MKKDCSNSNVDCFLGVKKCNDCNDYSTFEIDEKATKERDELIKIVDKRELRKLKKEKLLEIYEVYKDFTKEKLLNELIKVILNKTRFFAKGFKESEEYKKLKAKYPSCKWI